jgi:hypothetical protein
MYEGRLHNMGRLHAEELASGEFVIDLETQLAIHFSSNCYPPVPDFMIAVAKEAIKAVNNEQYDLEIELPAGVQFRNSTTVTAINAVDGLFLDSWINRDEDY